MIKNFLINYYTKRRNKLRGEYDEARKDLAEVWTDPHGAWAFDGVAKRMHKVSKQLNRINYRLKKLEGV